MQKNPGRRARTLFLDGYFCAESTFKALAEHLGVETNLIPRIATPFCSGMARTRGVCGAVTGCMMGIGLAAGRDESGQDEDHVYALTGQFLELFRNEHGTMACEELTGCDLGTDEGQVAFREGNLEAYCAGIVEQATTWTVSILEGSPET